MAAPIVRPWPQLAGIHVAFVRMDVPIDASLLTRSEQEIFEALPTERRRTEWWTGRMAAHAALRASCPSMAEGTSVLRDEKGAPFVHGAANSSGRIAISHGRRLAAAAATLKELPWPHVGIDIVDPEDIERVRRLSERVLTKHERALAERDPQIFRLAWGVREAVAKATRTGMFAFAIEHVHIDRMEGPHVIINLEGAEASYETTENDEMIVVAGVTEAAASSAQSRARGPHSPLR